MTRNSLKKGRLPGILVTALGAAATTLAQETLDQERVFIQESTDRLWYAILFLAGALVVGVALFYWFRLRSSAKADPAPAPTKVQATYTGIETQASAADVAPQPTQRKSNAAKVPTPAPPLIRVGTAAAHAQAQQAEEDNLELKIFQQKMRRMQYSQLPINSFTQLAPAKKYVPLPDSDDASLLNAIEQTNEEYEEDEMIRELALRILTAFRTRNSVEALSEIALYDLSSNLRAKAVTTLADFDHESVFETIMLACADPTREVRAAAARGLFKLSFDRAHAWKRLIETGDEFRMAHAARAAIESGIVVKSFERLINEDVKVAYEAFALVSLLIRSGETNEIFDAIKTHKDERVKFALLHVIKVSHDERALDRLNELRTVNSFPTDIADRMREVVASFETVAV